jgi:hypothetical protein
LPARPRVTPRPSPPTGTHGVAVSLIGGRGDGVEAAVELHVAAVVSRRRRRQQQRVPGSGVVIRRGAAEGGAPRAARRAERCCPGGAQLVGGRHGGRISRLQRLHALAGAEIAGVFGAQALGCAGRGSVRWGGEGWRSRRVKGSGEGRWPVAGRCWQAVRRAQLLSPQLCRCCGRRPEQLMPGERWWSVCRMTPLLVTAQAGVSRVTRALVRARTAPLLHQPRRRAAHLLLMRLVTAR